SINLLLLPQIYANLQPNRPSYSPKAFSLLCTTNQSQAPILRDKLPSRRILDLSRHPLVDFLRQSLSKNRYAADIALSRGHRFFSTLLSSSAPGGSVSDLLRI